MVFSSRVLRISGKIPRSFPGDFFQVMVQELTVVSVNGFEKDPQCESLIKNPLFHMDNPGLNSNWNAVDGEIQMNHFVAK